MNLRELRKADREYERESEPIRHSRHLAIRCLVALGLPVWKAAEIEWYKTEGGDSSDVCEQLRGLLDRLREDDRIDLESGRTLVSDQIRHSRQRKAQVTS